MIKHIPQERFFTASEVADLLKVTPRTVRRWIAEGLLPVVRFQRTVRIDRSDLEAFITRGRST